MTLMDCPWCEAALPLPDGVDHARCAECGVRTEFAPDAGEVGLDVAA